MYKRDLVLNALIAVDKVLQQFPVLDYEDYISTLTIDNPDNSNYLHLVTLTSKIPNVELVIERIIKDDSWQYIYLTYTDNAATLIGEGALNGEGIE